MAVRTLSGTRNRSDVPKTASERFVLTIDLLWLGVGGLVSLLTVCIIQRIRWQSTRTI